MSIEDQKISLVSVIVPTYNRGSKLEVVLRSLASQTFTNFEVIIVNDGSTDNTAEILEKLKLQSWPFHLRIIHQQNLGRSGVRNSGFALAQSPLIVSIDDDMRLDSRCIEVHYTHHQDFPGSILVGVQQEDPMLAKTDIQKFLSHQRVNWLQDLELAGNPMRPDSIYITAANFSISKTTFDKIGGFDTRLRAVVDYDLAMRATEIGVPIYYSKEAIGWHDDFITCQSFIKRRKQGVENERLLAQLKPALVAKYHRYKDNPPTGFKKVLYYILANNFFVKSIDHFNFYTILLPKKTRYKFYAAVIMALGKYYPHRFS